MTRAEALELQEKHGLDGIMLGRAIFQDPFVFAEESPWPTLPTKDKVELYIHHLELYRDTYEGRQRRFDPVKKFMKVYLSGFEGASELRAKIAETNNADDAIKILLDYL